jgi:predicted NAD/FAD-dependent oxidoreductase
VTVYEKSRGVGGRLATRRLEAGGIDHGAQYVTAREPAFRAFAARAKAERSLVTWTPRGKDGDDEWLVGMPKMSAFVAALIDNFTVVVDSHVVAITDSGAEFKLALADGTVAGPFARVVVALPGPQALALLAPFGAPFERIRDVRFGPCWTLMVGLSSALDPGFDVQRGPDPLAWVAASASKPGRTGNFWVVQATTGWSRDNLEATPDEIQPKLLAAFSAAVGPHPELDYATVHRWRYALVEQPVGEAFLLSPDGRIGACGDWMIAPRVECAWASGGGLADAIIARGRAG